MRAARFRNPGGGIAPAAPAASAVGEGASAANVLGWPLLGPLLKTRGVRTALRVGALVLAAGLVLHGLFGPPFGPENLATVVSWVHYRGLLVLALLAAGNLFCTACPFVLVRDAGRRLYRPARRWPRWLRTKWFGVALFAVILFAYEYFDLWALPRGTAVLILGYFVAALAIDLLFSGATFCKYLCPIGQFNFAASTLSPLEIRVRAEERCRTCGTHDCIRGNRVTGQRGCELALFLPMKVGNLDCTFCLDCVHACPHDNVALATRVPGLELLDTRRRAGIGRIAARPDVLALMVLFTFGGLLNAFAMAAPIHRVHFSFARLTGFSSEGAFLVALFAFGLALMPAAAIGAAAAATRQLTRGGIPIAGVAAQYIPTLVPIGVGVWLAHYGFHFLTAAWTIVPVTQKAAADLAGWWILGEPRWQWVGMPPGQVFPIQLGALLLGGGAALALAYLVSERDHGRRAGRAFVPWAVAIVLLTGFAIWLFSAPMDMRGTAGMG